MGMVVVEAIEVTNCANRDEVVERRWTKLMVFAAREERICKEQEAINGEDGEQKEGGYAARMITVAGKIGGRDWMVGGG